jgi:hypothetical protein
MAVIAGRNVGTNDLVVMGAGVLMFVDSFLAWQGITIKGLTGITRNAWGAGFGAWFSVLLIVAVGGVAAARVFAGRTMPAVNNGAVSWTLITGGVSVVAAVIILLRWVTYETYTGAKFGLFVGLIIAIVQAVFGYLSLVAAGEKLPWQKSTTA